MMTNIRERISKHITYSIVAIIFIVSIAIIIVNVIMANMDKSESQTILKLAKICGDREWIVYWAYDELGKRRNLKCLDRRVK